MSILHAHVTPDDLSDQTHAADEQWKASCLRTVEIMFLELREILVSNPELESVSFDTDYDTDSFPVFSCVVKEERDLDMTLVEQVAERWNASLHPSAVAFLELFGSHVFSRAHFESDVKKATKKLVETLPMSEREAKDWAASFVSHLHTIALNQTLPDVPSETPSLPSPRF